MNLQQTLVKIAHDFDLREDDLLRYASEDTETGWDDNRGAWPIGSLWQVEGQVLYALIRALKPKRLLELGTWHGCSATHMLLAMRRNDNNATLICVDNDKHETGAIGALIPPRLRTAATITNQPIAEYLQSCVSTFDFVFSDGSHDSPSIAIIWQARSQLLNAGGIIIEHDALHFGVGDQVMRGIRAAGADPRLYKTEPSDCGLAIEQMPLEDEPLDYDTMQYNELWALTGPKQRDMRAWMSEITGMKTRPKKPDLIDLLNQWDSLPKFKGFEDELMEGFKDKPPSEAHIGIEVIESSFVDENGDGVDDRSVTHRLESAEKDGKKKARNIKNGE